MEVISTVFDSVIGIAIGLLMIKFANQIAAFVSSVIGNSIIRDTNNPWVYKVLGFLLMIVSFIKFFI